MIKPSTSYYIKSSSDFLTHTLKGFIQHINSIHGVSVGQSVFGKRLIFSDTEMPSKHKIVISSCDRHEAEFELINIDENWVSLFCQINDVKNKNIKKFISHLRGSLEEKYMLMLQILQCLTPDGGFDDKMASNIVNKEYSLNFATKDKVASLIGLISNFNYSSWLTFTKLVSENDYGLIISIIDKANNGEMKELPINSTIMKNLLEISVCMLKTENFFDFQLAILKRVTK